MHACMLVYREGTAREVTTRQQGLRWHRCLLPRRDPIEDEHSCGAQGGRPPLDHTLTVHHTHEHSSYKHSSYKQHEQHEQQPIEPSDDQWW